MTKSWRLWLVTFIAFLSYSALVFNIYTLQVQNGSYYSARAESQLETNNSLSQRGTIYLKDKNDNKIPAALNREYPVIVAVPDKIEDPLEASSLLAPILDISAEALFEKLNRPGDLHELLVAKAGDQQVDQINQLELKGIYVASQHFRFYPFSSLAAQLLGFVGLSEENDLFEGQYGLEAFYNDTLRREDLVLTIDRNIQSQAEKILAGVIKKYGAEKGTVIVQDPKTGKILALGNYPDFDPNNYSEYPLKNFINPALQSVYEPGSVFKIITMAAGIDSGKITPETKYYDNGSLTLNGETIRNWDLKAHGWSTMTEVIEQSINTGAAFAEQKTGHDNFYNYLLKFGFKEPTGVALPGEVFGTLRNLEEHPRDINFATASFGQGISTTPLQLINAISAIANRGLLMRPYFIDGTPSEVIGSVISEQTAEQVIEMMVSAVKKAKVAHIDGYEIAGKTGTAQIPDFVRGGYSNDFIHTYVGFAPASDPRFNILIKIDKPYGAPVAGLTVVPAFRELAQFIINYYNIPADDIEKQ